ncbi:unnamed protein product, partial [Didymodactylos carnosus]
MPTMFHTSLWLEGHRTCATGEKRRINYKKNKNGGGMKEKNWLIKEQSLY